MVAVILWSVIFSVVSAASIVLLGSRDFIDGQMTFSRMIRIIFDWRFIIGAILAFGARLIFVMTNNAIAKLPHLANSSTTATSLVNVSAVLLVVLANHYFLGDRLNMTQGLGAFLVIFGIILITK